MEVLIFIFYLVLFSFFVSIIPFFKTSAIGKKLLITLFLIKVFAGVAYAKFYTLPKYYPGADTWRFYRVSLDETKWLLRNPWAFVKDLFINNYNNSGNLFTGENSYWNDLKSNVIIKMMAIVNIFTNSSYYANIIFFNFLFLFGLVALCRLFYQLFPHKRSLIIVGIFLLPSALFWCSGIHKDGLILSATGIILYTFYKGLDTSFSLSRIIIISFCALVLFSLRSYVLFALIPAMLSWWLCEKFPGNKIGVFALVYTTGIFFFFVVTLVFPSINLLSYIADKQHEFLLLEGGSKVSIPRLQPSFPSFISFIPDALDMVFLRPHINEIRNISYIPAIAENVFFLLLLSISVIYVRKVPAEPVMLAVLFFSISIMLLIGFTIPFAGAVVRYKSFVLPVFITPLLCITNFFPLNRIKK